MSQQKHQLAQKLAQDDIHKLEYIYEFTTRETYKHGKMRAHFCQGDYFFFSNGKEVFRSGVRQYAINFLADCYINNTKNW